jgi:hypothetical protein
MCVTLSASWLLPAAASRHKRVASAYPVANSVAIPVLFWPAPAATCCEQTCSVTESCTRQQRLINGGREQRNGAQKEDHGHVRLLRGARSGEVEPI